MQKPRRDRGTHYGRRRDESGTALVELALVVPLVILLLGVAFNGWNAMQTSIRLTSAARAGAIQAANDLGTDPSQISTALSDATTVINDEEGVTGVYQSSNSGANNYVSMKTAPEVVSGGSNGVTINVVTITITESSASFVPFVGSFPVTTHATARYS
jgi:Flp pilus assembly protein TadG